tara:strand:- start:155 stop:682 length:528 start_codon:yes stop_codon:yes gene_type:complete
MQDDILMLIVKSLYFFLPAYIGNMAPVILKKFPFLNIPIHGKIFGAHKTWRGLLLAVIMGGLVFWLQKIAFLQGFRSWSIIDYGDFSILLGLLMGGGAIVGDLVKSYYKRKEKIPPGKSWVPFDQVDFVIGGLVFTCFIYVPAAPVIVTLLVASPLLHVLFNYLGYLIRIKDNKF